MQQEHTRQIDGMRVAQQRLQALLPRGGVLHGAQVAGGSTAAAASSALHAEHWAFVRTQVAAARELPPGPARDKKRRDLSLRFHPDKSSGIPSLSKLYSELQSYINTELATKP